MGGVDTTAHYGRPPRGLINKFDESLLINVISHQPNFFFIIIVTHGKRSVGFESNGLTYLTPVGYIWLIVFGCCVYIKENYGYPRYVEIDHPWYSSYNSKYHSLSHGAIAGIVIGCLVLVAMVIIVSMWVARYYRRPSDYTKVVSIKKLRHRRSSELSM